MYVISLANTAIAKEPLFGITIAKGSVNGSSEVAVLALPQSNTCFIDSHASLVMSNSANLV